MPVGFRYNPEHDAIDIGGHSFARRKKFRDVQQNHRVAFVVDDLASTQPWRPRGIEIRGQAEILKVGGKGIMANFDDEMFRIRPERIFSWGLAGGIPGAGRDVHA
jgi:pyridoxamine 5'-phosphate oxidase family protein